MVNTNEIIKAEDGQLAQEKIKVLEDTVKSEILNITNSQFQNNWFFWNVNFDWLYRLGHSEIANMEQEKRFEIIKNNYTAEQMVKDFCQGATELHKFSVKETKKTESLEKDIKDKDEQIRELTVFKEWVEDLKEKNVELLTAYYKEEEKEEKSDWDYWHKEDLKSLMSKNESKPVEVSHEVIGKWEADAKDRAEALDVTEEWKNRQVEDLENRIEEQSVLLEKSSDELEKERTSNKELREELDGEKMTTQKLQEELEKEREQNRELRWQLHLEKKPLPKKGFRLLGLKIENKFSQLAQKIKSRTQKVVARIEVKTK
jgi:hypothetical protein